MFQFLLKSYQIPLFSRIKLNAHNHSYFSSPLIVNYRSLLFSHYIRIINTVRVSLSTLILGFHSNVVGVSEHQHAISILIVNELARSDGLPQRDPHVLALVTVVVAHNLLDGSSGLSGVVKGNSRDVVVQHMSLDDIVENVLAHETKVAVNSGSSTSGKRPLVVVVVGHGGVRVLQESDENKPVVDPQPGHEPVDEHVEEAVVLGPQVHGGEGGHNTDVQQHHVPVLMFLEHRGRRHIVRLANHRVALVLLAGSVNHQVRLQARKLLEKKHQRRPNGRLLHEIGDFGHALGLHVLLLGVWDKHHVTRHVAGSLMVLGVGEFPREVGNDQVRVQNPANHVVDILVVRKRTMATLVGKNPQAKAKETNEVRVHHPEGASGHSRGGLIARELDLRDVGEAHVADGHHQNNIANHISERSDQGAVVAVLGNGRKNILNGVVGDLEVVSESVHSDQIGRRLGI